MRHRGPSTRLGRRSQSGVVGVDGGGRGGDDGGSGDNALVVVVVVVE